MGRRRRAAHEIGSDGGGHSRRDDRHAGAGADADPDRNRDLTEREATRSQTDNAAGERQHRDDLAARTFEEVRELRQRRIEGAVRAGERHFHTDHRRKRHQAGRDGNILANIGSFHFESIHEEYLSV